MEDEKRKRFETLSTERRKFIGQAIIEGLLTPTGVFPVGTDIVASYAQDAGNYVQRGANDTHGQGPGNYDQGGRLTAVREEIVAVLRDLEMQAKRD